MSINTTGTNGNLGNLGYQTENPSTNLTDYPAEIRAITYSKMVQELIKDGLFSDSIARDVSDFMDGASVSIPQFGEVVLYDGVEGAEFTEDQISTSSITLSIQKNKAGKNGLTDEMKEDSYLASEIEASFVRKQARAISEEYEKDLFGQQSKQIVATTALGNAALGIDVAGGSGCVISGAPHRWVAGTDGTITLNDFARAKYALDKANIPSQGRIAVIPPEAELVLNSLVGSQAFSTTSHFEDMADTGFANNNQFYGSIYGFDIYVSNRLSKLGSETLNTFDNIDLSTGEAVDSAQSINVEGMVAALFMSVYDEDTKPFMSAWRRQPKVSVYRREELHTDFTETSARWGTGIQRPESLVVIATK